MNSEFENEHEPPKVRLVDLIATIRTMLQRGNRLGASTFVGGVRVHSSDIAHDQAEFESQLGRLDGHPTLIVELEDEGGLSGRERVAVPIDLKFPSNLPIDRHFASLKASLRKAGFRPRLAQPKEAREAFFDRAAETLGLRVQPPSVHSLAPGSDRITSKNIGDDILCAKGWFLSTGHIVGQSICTITVKPGRYSLGVSDGRHTRYHPRLFSLPIGSVHLNLP